MSVRYEQRVDIRAPRERVWDVLTDVEHWPLWAPTVTSAVALDGTFHAGSRWRVKQPRLGETVWTVTDAEPGTVFTWTASSPGVSTLARHEIVTADGDQATVSLVVEHTGPGARFAHLVFGRLTRRYLEQEAAGLKARCER